MELVQKGKIVLFLKMKPEGEIYNWLELDLYLLAEYMVKDLNLWFWLLIINAGETWCRGSCGSQKYGSPMSFAAFALRAFLSVFEPVPVL